MNAKNLMLVVALVALMFGGFVSSASAAGGGIPTTPSGNTSVGTGSTSSYVDLGDVRYSVGTSGGTNQGFYLDLSTSCGVINNASVGIHRNSTDSLNGTVEMYVSGVLDVSPTLVDWKSQSTNVQRRGGFNLSTYAGIGSYQPAYGSGDPAVWTYGDIFSTANLNASLSSVVGITYSYANYREEDAYQWTWIDWNDVVHTMDEPARFWMNANWNVQFADMTSAAMAFGMGATSVPEPATMSLLALGMMGFIARRKRS